MSKCKFRKQCKLYKDDSETCNRLAGYRCGKFREFIQNQKTDDCKCGGTIIHPRLYFYECKRCGFQYEMDPASSKPITILSEGKI